MRTIQTTVPVVQNVQAVQIIDRSRIRVLLEDLKKRRWEVDAIGGEKLAKLAKEVVTQPPEVIERMKKLLGN